MGNVIDEKVLEGTELTREMVEEMYRYMAIANYEDRFVIPSGHREEVVDSFDEKGSCGFSFGNACSDGVSETSLFGTKKKGSTIFVDMPKSRKKMVEGV